MDTGVNLNEHPDRWRHVAHASPHRQHSTSMVVLLKSRAALSFDQNDRCVKDFVEFGEIEPPAPESKTLIPHPANISGVWKAIGTNVDVRIPASPSIRIWVVCDSITKASWTLDLAERVNSANKRIGLSPVGERCFQAVEHGHAGDCRVDSEKYVVGDNKCLEPAVAGNPPWLVAMLAVVPVEVGDRNGVDGGDGQGDLGVKRLLEDILRDLEWICECRFTTVWVRDRRRRSVRR